MDISPEPLLINRAPNNILHTYVLTYLANFRICARLITKITVAFIQIMCH